MSFGVSVDFNANVAKFSTQVDKINRDLTKFSRQVDQSANRSNAAFDSMAAGARSAGIAFVAAFAAKGVYGGIKSMIDEQETLQRNLRRTEAIIKATGASAGLNTGHLHEQARELAFATLQSTEGIMEAQQVLLTFKEVSGDTFTQAIELANDLAVVTGQDLKGATTQLGKALQEPVKGMNAMARSGVSFTEQSREMIKGFVNTNQLAKAQQVILSELAGQYQGVAINEASGFSGAVDTMNQRIQEFNINLENNTGLMDSFTQGVDFISTAMFALDQAINGVNTGLVDIKLGAINREVSTAKDELRRLTEKSQRTGGRNGNTVVNEKILVQEELINSLLKKRDVIMGELNKKRLAVNKANFNTQLGSFADDFISDIQGPAPQEKPASAIPITSVSRAMQQMTGPGSEWNKLMEEAARLTEQTRTPLENLTAEIEKYADFADRGLINQETLNRALTQAGEEYDALTEKVKESSEQMDTYADQAARNMQDAFADFLFDPFDDGLEGMLSGFTSVIKRMVAEQASAQIFGSEGLNLGGLFSSAVGGVFGGIFGKEQAQAQAQQFSLPSPAQFQAVKPEKLAAPQSIKLASVSGQGASKISITRCSSFNG